MANRKRIKLILAEKSRLGLEVSLINWDSSFYKNKIYDFRIKTNLFGKVIEGSGFSTNESIAFLKAFSESVERSFCCEYGIRSTNGVAAHWSFGQAKVTAENELIERDIFLCHFLTKTPGEIVKNKEIDDINKKLQVKRIQVVRLTTFNNRYTHLCVGHSLKGYVIGLGTSLRLEDSLEKSILECLCRLIPEPLNKPNIRNFNSPLYHLHFHLNSHSLLKAGMFRTKDKNYKMEEKNLSMHEEVNKVGSLKNLIPSLNIDIVRVSSFDKQNVFYGKTINNKLNIERLEQFLREKSLSPQEYERMIHPLG